VSSLDPIVLFFILGLVAGLARSDLRLPGPIYEFLSVVLLLAIGLKGGVELAEQSLAALLPQIIAVVIMGSLLPLAAYPLLRFAGRLSRVDSAAIAAHYGSVSVGTYAVAVAWLVSRNISFEEHLPLLLVMLEVPAIVVGIVLARGFAASTDWKRLGHEVFLGKSIVLLIGGLLIGWAAGPEALEPVSNLFFGLFHGVLALFLLEMGLVAAGQVGSLRRHGLFLVAFGVLFPLFGAVVGGGLGLLLGLSPGGTMLLATLAASASYIAVPAALRLALPEANPTLSLTASLGVTFPFNILVGIPLYMRLAESLHSIGG
jgi:uncharacterized protein